MNFLAVIPARGGSKGLPRKNILLVAGKPLIAWTIEAAKGCSSIGKIVVSTDSSEIAEIALSYGAEVCMRPLALAQDSSPTLPVIQHCLEQSIESGFNPDAILTLQPTSPLRTSIHLKEAIELFSSHSEADSLVSVVSLPHHFSPESLMIKNDDFVQPLVEKSVLRRQEKKSYYARNGAAIYITRAQQLSHYIWGGKTLGYEMDKISSIDIDDSEDLKLAEIILKHR